ncbi:MAG: hypothetical protein NVS4B13_09040 [Candidatus Elarobacter sp.]
MPADPKAVDGRIEPARFAGLSYERFRSMAADSALSANEKIGMPDALRDEFDRSILADVIGKLPALGSRQRAVVDIGSGCGSFAAHLIEHCRAMGHALTTVDSAEMLEHLPAAPFLRKVPGRFPLNASAVAATVPEGADIVLAYGVLSAVFVDANPFSFVDQAAALLAPSGRLLVGDLPNVSKLRRFLASEAGVRYHKEYMRTDEAPRLEAFDPPGDRIDDGVVLGIVDRMRRSGYDAYVLPQSDALPLANRREDILIVRP